MYILYILLPLVLIIGLLVGIFVFAAKKSRNNNSGNQSNSTDNGNTAGNAKIKIHANKLCPACQTEYDFYNDIRWEEYRKESDPKGTKSYIKGVKTCPKCGNEVRFNTVVYLRKENHYDAEAALKKKWDTKNSLFNALDGGALGNDGKAF